MKVLLLAILLFICPNAIKLNEQESIKNDYQHIIAREVSESNLYLSKVENNVLTLYIYRDSECISKTFDTATTNSISNTHYELDEFESKILYGVLEWHKHQSND